MGNLPTVGADNNVWGNELNAWLLADHDVDGTHGFNAFIPADHGYLTWNYDPGLISASTAALTTGTIFLSRVNVRYAMSVFNVIAQVSAAGGTLTTGQNFAALFNSTGTRTAVTADQTTNWGGTGLMTMALSGGPFSLSTGYYWVALLANGTTGPQFARGGNGQTAAINAGMTATTARSATNSTGQTSMPSSITPSSNVLASNNFWCALS